MTGDARGLSMRVNDVVRPCAQAVLELALLGVAAQVEIESKF